MRNLAAMKAMLGIDEFMGTPPEAPPKTLAEARNYIHLHDLPQLEAAFDASKREGDISRSQYRLAPTSSEDVGQERWISVEGTLVRSAEGQPVRWLGVTRDITARKRAEEHQQFLNSELDHRVKNVLATVNAIVTQTREASSTHADFVTGLGHRLKSLASTHELLSQAPMARRVAGGDCPMRVCPICHGQY